MSRPIFFQCVVLDNNDPLCLGRVRARIKTQNYEDTLRGIEDWDPITDIWTAKDPFIFNPLLPYFFYQVPNVEEIIQVIFVNREFQYQNQYYVQNNFFSPNSTFNIYNVGGDKFTGTGMQLKSPRPIKNKDGTYPNTSEKGLYPEPGDTGIMGRGSSDVIVGPTNLLMRAGKYKSPPQSNVTFAGNTQRSFVQLSIFDQIKKQNPPTKITNTFPVTLQVNYLIEWVITNPENLENKFCGGVYLYQLKPDQITNSKNLQISTVVPERLKNLVVSETFFSLSVLETAQFINNFIKTCNDNVVTKSGKRLFYDENNKFPFYFRPNNITYSFINPATTSNFVPTPSEVCPTGDAQNIQKNINSIFALIKLNPSDEPGFGLVWKKDTVGAPTQTNQEKIQTEYYESSPSTYATMGADKVFLLSHQSQIDGKQKINLDGTLYGISGSTYFDDIIPNTSSMVRGEELLELINLIVRFLVTHTHAYPGLPPVPVTQDGSNVTDLLTELQNAAKKVLNSNIRLN